MLFIKKKKILRLMFSSLFLLSILLSIVLLSTSATFAFDEEIKHEYTVSFNTNGGGLISDQLVQYGGLVIEPELPSKLGYFFGGWYTDEELLSGWDFLNDTMPQENLILNAKWVDKTDKAYREKLSQKRAAETVNSNDSLILSEGFMSLDSFFDEKNLGFENNLANWNTYGNVTVVTEKTVPADENTWGVLPRGSQMAVLVPNGESGVFPAVASTLGLSEASRNYILGVFPRITDAAYIYTDMVLEAGEEFSIGWNYVATDYDPYNDASFVSLVNMNNPQNVPMVNGVYAEVGVLGATVIGTGNYSTGSYGSTGWQLAELKITYPGTYRLGFTVYNLDDTAFEPYLFVDDGRGVTYKNGTEFAPIPPDEEAPEPPESVSVTYNPTTFAEAESNDGSITTISEITLSGDTFTGEVGHQITSFIASNVPEGLSVVITKTDSNKALMTLTGKALQHRSSNNISNLTIAFEDAAFSGNNASIIAGAMTNFLNINFEDPEEYTVEFNTNGGNQVASQFLFAGDLIVNPGLVTREGYCLDDWFSDESLTQIWDFDKDTMPEHNITLYAKWTPNPDTAYIVEHYQQDVTGEGYTKFETENLTGTTDTTATAAAKTYAGFSENTTHTGRIANGNIKPDGTLVLKLYYDREEIKVTFKDYDGALIEEVTVRYKGTAATPADPERTGYTFAGWYGQYEGVTEDQTVTATYTPNPDTEYIVEHYRQDITGDGYTKFETDNLTGTTDTTATAVAKAYAGFSENTTHEGRTASGNIEPDGTLVLKLYYDREEIKVTFTDYNGTLIEEVTVRYEGTAATPADPDRTGYTFAGWEGQYEGVTADQTVTATYTPNPDTDYKVEHYRQDITGDGYTKFETDNLTGTTDTTATAVAKAYAGFSENTTHEGRTASGNIEPDGTLVLKLYYDREEIKVTFTDYNGTLIEEVTVRYEGTAATPADPDRTGYTFAGWEGQYEGVTADQTVTATYTPNPDTDYKVEHYRQDVTGDGYTKFETENLTGTTDTTATAAAKAYAGFSENTAHEGRVPSGNIEPDGTLVLKLYYDREEIKVTFTDYNGTLIEEVTVRYEGTAATPADPDRTGYTFAGWEGQYEGVTADQTVTATYTPNPDTDYKVEHYRQDVTGDGYTKFETENLTGTTDTTATAAAKAYAGFSENTAHEGRVPSGNIEPDGTLVLKLYYDREEIKVTFTDYNGTLIEEVTVRYEGTAATPADPERTGYTFAGWDGQYESVTEDQTVTATYTPNPDTDYKVEHYRQDVTGDGYTKFETENLTGTTDTTATAAAKTYVGFSENTAHEVRVPSGNIAPDGTLVLKLYYDREEIKVTFTDYNGTLIEEKTVRYEGTAATPADPERTGYTFAGWDGQYESVTADQTVTATYTPNPDTAYKVEHYRQDITGDGYTKFETENLTGTTDTTATAAAKAYAGFSENTAHEGRVPSGNIEPDGTLVLKLYYDREEIKVTFTDYNGTLIEEVTVRYEGTAATPADPERTGYTFAGWDGQYESVTADQTVTATYTPNTDTAYKVEHYQQDVTGEGYTKFETENLTGTTDTTATAAAKAYAGFSENTAHEGRVPSGNIEPDGTLVLKLYYDREEIKVTFKDYDGALIEEVTVRYEGTAATPADPERTGYTFVGWDGQYESVTEDQTVTATYTPNPDTDYKVEHYQQDVTGEGYTKFETENLTGTTDTTATAVAKAYAGLSENTTHEGRTASGNIEPDGTLVLKLYYDREEIKVTFTDYNGTLIEEVTVRYEGTAATPADPDRTGYTFAGWEGQYEGVTADQTVTATYTPNPDTDYKVEHYRQDVTGEGYTKFETENLTGTTDTTATAVAKAYAGLSENTAHEGRVPSGNIEPDGTLVLKLYYDREEIKVTFTDYNGTLIEEVTVRYEGTAATPADPERTGYTFAGWDGQYESVTEDQTVTATYTPNPDTDYKVEHYRQDVTGDGYTKFETENLTGTTDTTATAAAKAYAGFSENTAHEGRVPSGNIEPDGTLVLKLYYDREEIKVTFTDYNGTLIEEVTVRYEGTAATPADPDRTGYTFAGWEGQYEGVTADQTVTATYTPNPDTDYKVEHYRQDVTGDGYTKFETENLTGTTDTTATAAAKAYAGFSENTAHEGRVPSGNIEPDGTLVLKLYYDREEIKVTFTDYNGTLIEEVTVRYEGTAATPADPERTGYTFVGWDGQYESVTADQTVTATYTINEYSVNFVTNGGNAIGNQVINYGELVTKPHNPHRGGYDFVAWYSDNTLTKLWDFNKDKITENITLYAKWRHTPKEDSDEDEEEQVIVIVNGKEENAGTETKGEENGKTYVTVSVLPEIIDNKIEEALSEKTDNTQNVVQIPVKDKTSEKVNVALTGDIVKKLEDNEFHISVSRDSVQYNIPAKEITITAVAEELNVSSSSLRDIQVEIQIINVDEEIQQKYKEMVEENNSEIIFPPTEFNIVAKVSKLDGNNESVNVSKFNNYVERVIEIPEGIDPSSITTGIVFNADGTYSHVPTVVFESSGKWYAKINSLTNSTYSVIENSIKVSAVKGHWSEESVNDMASRLVILDVDTFKPDEAITRADFALYIVRALGLYRTESSELQSYCFTDVDKSDPAFIGISIACSYGLIKGYPDGTFKPQATITRQEAMTMYARAMDIVKLTIIKNDKINSYTDSKEVAAWAYDSVQKTISSGIFNGRSKTIIAPEGIFTYAEAAKAIRNILINSGLING